MTVYDSAISSLLTASGVLVALMGYARLNRNDSKESTKEGVMLSTKMDMVLNSLQGINTKLDRHDIKFSDIENNVTRLEERLNSHIKETH